MLMTCTSSLMDAYFIALKLLLINVPLPLLKNIYPQYLSLFQFKMQAGELLLGVRGKLNIHKKLDLHIFLCFHTNAIIISEYFTVQIILISVHDVKNRADCKAQMNTYIQALENIMDF